MYLMYIDEAGYPGSLGLNDPNIQPALSVGGLVIAANRVSDLTKGWIDIKQRFFPHRLPREGVYLDWQTLEIKGNEVRKNARSSRRRESRQAKTFLHATLNLLEDLEAFFISRTYIKVPGAHFDGIAAYTFSVQYLCERLQAQLSHMNVSGLVIADSRRKGQNSNASHSVFTQKYRAAGDPLPNLLETIVFGHSDNHAGLQIADILVSALVFPISVYAFMNGQVNNLHIHPEYEFLARGFVPRLLDLRTAANCAPPLREQLSVCNELTYRGVGYLIQQYGTPATP